MKNAFIKKIKEILIKKESGDGGISYAMYFITVIIVLVLYVFFIFNSNLLVAEEIIENGLHISENETLSINQAHIDGTNTRVDEFERVLKILQIITEYDPTSNALSSTEREQVEAVGTELSNTLQERLRLTGSTPSGGILSELCDPGTQVLLRGGHTDKGNMQLTPNNPGVVIYEPIYIRTVTPTLTAGIPTAFTITYDIDKWIRYDFIYDTNNTLQSVDKQIIEKDEYNKLKLHNGDPVEGATIEAIVSLNLAGVNNIFANVSSASGPLFSRHPERAKYSVCVIQAADIVPVSEDKRKQ